MGFYPLSGDMSEQAAYSPDMRASWQEMGKGYRFFVMVKELVFAGLNEAATCETRNLWTVVKTYNHDTQ